MMIISNYSQLSGNTNNILTLDAAGIVPPANLGARGRTMFSISAASLHLPEPPGKLITNLKPLSQPASQPTK